MKWNLTWSTCFTAVACDWVRNTPTRHFLSAASLGSFLVPKMEDTINICFPQFYGWWCNIKHPFLVSPKWLSTGPWLNDKRLNKLHLIWVAEGSQLVLFYRILDIDHHISRNHTQTGVCNLITLHRMFSSWYKCPWEVPALWPRLIHLEYSICCGSSMYNNSFGLCLLAFSIIVNNFFHYWGLNPVLCSF